MRALLPRSNVPRRAFLRVRVVWVFLEMMFLIKDPSKHGSFGLTKDWKTSVNNVPKGLDGESFDKWLWKKNV